MRDGARCREETRPKLVTAVEPGEVGERGQDCLLDFHGRPFRPERAGTSLEGLLLHGRHWGGCCLHPPLP